MKSAALRWTTFCLFVAVLMTAAYLSWTTESRSRSASSSGDMFKSRASALTLAIMELRMGQQAYVAAGQGDEFWALKVAAQIGAIRDQLSALAALASQADAKAEVEEAASALSDFERMDTRAREYSRGNQRLLASDLIFSDGLEKTAAMITALQRAADVESAALEALMQAARKRMLTIAGGSTLLSVLFGLALLPVPRQARDQTPVQLPAAHDEPAQETSLMLRDVRDPEPPPVVEIPPSIREVEPLPKDPVDLGSLASLCTDLAQLVDTRTLPRVLERTASVLDANGVVLWVADPDGRELNPVVTHGYPQQLVTRLGTIPREAQNATAAAFRTALLQTVHADSISHGAIAVPLVTPGGCVGVMAAEVRDGGEKDEVKLAAAAIVVAQLATVVGPPSRSSSRHEAAGARA